MTGFTLLKEVVPTLFLSIDPSASSFRDKLARMVQKQGQIRGARETPALASFQDRLQ